MVKKRFSVSLDVKSSSSNRPIEVVEGDSGNEIGVALTDGGAPVDLTGCRVLAVFSKSDGRTAQQDNDGHGVVMENEKEGRFTIELYTGSFSPGLVECEIQALSGEAFATLVTSAKFNFSCRRSIMNRDTVQATNEYPILSDMIARVTEAEDRLSAIAEQENARKQAESGRLAAEEERQTEEEQRRALAEKWRAASAETDTLPPGSAATAAVTLEERGAVFTFGIPRGEKGTPGDNALPHAAQHAENGSDALLPAMIGAANAQRDYDTETAKNFDMDDFKEPGVYAFCSPEISAMKNVPGSSPSGVSPALLFVGTAPREMAGRCVQQYFVWMETGALWARSLTAEQDGAQFLACGWRRYGFAPQAVSAVLYADGWTDGSPARQTMNIGGVAADRANIHIVFDLAENASQAETEAAFAGILRATGQGDGTLTVTAFGDVPKIDIPVNALILR